MQLGNTQHRFRKEYLQQLKWLILNRNFPQIIDYHRSWICLARCFTLSWLCIPFSLCGSWMGVAGDENWLSRLVSSLGKILKMGYKICSLQFLSPFETVIFFLIWWDVWRYWRWSRFMSLRDYKPGSRGAITMWWASTIYRTIRNPRSGKQNQTLSLCLQSRWFGPKKRVFFWRVSQVFQH